MHAISFEVDCDAKSALRKRKSGPPLLCQELKRLELALAAQSEASAVSGDTSCHSCGVQWWF